MKTKMVGLMAMLLAAGCSTAGKFDKFALLSVSVTNLSQSGGGSGTIVSTSESHSEILTNAHVCLAVRKGGLVNTFEGPSYFITAMRISKQYDLCLVSVGANLKHSAIIANIAPRIMSKATVAGHPSLLPLIVTEGHFSSKVQINVSSFRECNKLDELDETHSFFCGLFGKIPVIETFEAVVVSNLIQAGSSGSGVFNENDELAAVIFSGAEGTSFGMAVPFEFMYEFLTVEIDTLKPVIPSTTTDNLPEPTLQGDTDSKVKEYCSKHKSNICDLIKNNKIKL